MGDYKTGITAPRGNTKLVQRIVEWLGDSDVDDDETDDELMLHNIIPERTSCCYTKCYRVDTGYWSILHT
jgi:hypothetical protein